MTTTSHASVSYRDLQPQDVDELIELHEQCFPVRCGSSAPIHPRRASGRPSHTAAARARLSPRARRYSRAFYDNAVQGKLANSHYRLTLPPKDPRFSPKEGRGATGDDPLYCGKLRSYNLSGANFVVYDDGYKAEEKKGAGSRQPPAEAPRRQLAAMVFQARPAPCTPIQPTFHLRS